MILTIFLNLLTLLACVIVVGLVAATIIVSVGFISLLIRAFKEVIINNKKNKEE